MLLLDQGKGGLVFLAFITAVIQRIGESSNSMWKKTSRAVRLSANAKEKVHLNRLAVAPGKCTGVSDQSEREALGKLQGS